MTAARALGSRNDVLDLIPQIAAKYRDPDIARFAIGDFCDAIEPIVASLVAAETGRIAGLLRRAAAGRSEYADGAPQDTARILRAQAAAFESAARLCADPSVLRSLIPSRRWTEEDEVDGAIQPVDDDQADHRTDFADEARRQDDIHPGEFPATRDGIRLALACLDDEVKEALDAWREERRGHGWENTRKELLQAGGIAIRAVRSIDEAADG